MLRVHHFGFSRMNAEERRVETVRVLQHSASRNVVAAAPQGRSVQSRLGKLRVAKEGNAFLARNQIGPELLDAFGAGEPPGHADDSDAFVGSLGQLPSLLSFVRSCASACL